MKQQKGKQQKGFTIIEVMLFLALSGFLLAGILAGTGSSIANQRYKDAVQDAADALRSAFSFVADTQIETRDNQHGACGGTVEEANAIDMNDMFYKCHDITIKINENCFEKINQQTKPVCGKKAKRGTGEVI